MNKIQIKGEPKDEVLKLDEDTVMNYTNCEKDINIETNKDIKVFIYIENSKLNINFNIKDNLILNIFSENSTIKVNLNLNKENINLNYAYSTINEGDNNYIVNINHFKKNTKSIITNHGINLENNDLNFIINAFVLKDVTNVITTQNSKIILIKEKGATIKPNLLIENDDIIANHSAYIGTYKKSDLFYLKTRGLTEKSAQKLLAKSFLIGNMQTITFRQIQKINDKLNTYWRW